MLCVGVWLHEPQLSIKRSLKEAFPCIPPSLLKCYTKGQLKHVSPRCRQLPARFSIRLIGSYDHQQLRQTQAKSKSQSKTNAHFMKARL